jgi:hypothetical protein
VPLLDCVEIFLLREISKHVRRSQSLFMFEVITTVLQNAAQNGLR